MHLQLFLFALVAPLALSLPQPISQGESSALIPRQESGNSTGGAREGGRHEFEGKKRHRGSSHPERDLIERQESGNSTGGSEEGGRHGFEGKGHHHDSSHPERDLTERQESGNSTGGAEEGGRHGFEGKGRHGIPSHPERDLSERQESSNSTSGGERHGDGKFHHEGHPGPKVDKRIEEGNGTTGGETGRQKFTPDGYHGGLQRPDEHKRSIVDAVLDRRQDNSTSDGAEGEGRGRHGSEKGHFGHNGSE